MELLRFITAGSVDDGKSTLIGRLLYDTKSIFDDQLQAIEEASSRSGSDEVNLALLTDGLRAEREQGITIDVAYRYFSTPKRKFIIADAPGHIEYTRNMITGASTSDAAVILIDARNGVVEQTRRHTYLARLLGLSEVLVAVNKMDLVDFSEKVFNDIKEEYQKILAKTPQIAHVNFIPISAKNGDNVVKKSDAMPWYKGDTLLGTLENVQIRDSSAESPFRYDVQYVIRPQTDEFHDYRGYAGRVLGGSARVGDEVEILPSRTKSRIKSINLGEEELQGIEFPLSASIQLEDDVDVSRGSLIVSAGSAPKGTRSISAVLCVLSSNGLKEGVPYFVRHGSTEVQGMVNAVNYRLDINTLEKGDPSGELQMNDIVGADIVLSDELFCDLFTECKGTGSFILIDENTNETAAVGLIEE